MKVTWTLRAGVLGMAALFLFAAPQSVDGNVDVDTSFGNDVLERVIHDVGLQPARKSVLDSSREYTDVTTSLNVAVGESDIPYRYMAVAALPGETLAISSGGADASRLALRYREGVVEEDGATGWSWTAPGTPGVYPLRIEGPDSRFAHLNVLVMHPMSEVVDGELNGYAIGTYRSRPLRGNPIYLPPEGFVEVALSDRDLLVSPHFTLGQFLCKQPGTPSYLVLSLPLVLKLEVVLKAVNEAGHATPTFFVMSGFRTPAYNRAIGNRTSYSRHLWGDAADIFIDVDGNGIMDDINANGRSDVGDARVLAAIVDEVESRGTDNGNVGGVGVYRANSTHGPFVHVDARGHRARW